MQKEKQNKKIKKRRKLHKLNCSKINSSRKRRKYNNRIKTKKRNSKANVSFLNSNTIKEISSNNIGFIRNENEHNSLEIVKSLYPKIKNDIDIFFNYKTFNDKTSPDEFLIWILKMYKEVNNNCELELVYTKNGYDIASYYDIEEYSYSGRSAELNFLPSIKDFDEDLFNMYICLFNILNNKYHVPFYFNDDAIERSIEIVEEELYNQEELNKKDVDFMKKSLKEYQEGSYLLIEDLIRKNKTSEKDLKKHIDNYEPLDELQKKHFKVIKDCFYNLINIFDNISFNDLVFLTKKELKEYTPITPYDYCKLGWSYDEDNIINRYAEMERESIYNEYGIAPFRLKYLSNNIIDDFKKDKRYLFLREYCLFLESLYSF